MLNNLAGVAWKRGTGASLCRLLVKRYIFRFFSCDKKFIKVNVKSTFYCSLLRIMSINTCLINRCLSSASAVIRSWFIYGLQKCTRIAFSRNSLYSFYPRNPTCEIPPSLRISNCKYPPFLRNSSSKSPPSPSEILKAIRGNWIWIFSGIAHYVV